MKIKNVNDYVDEVASKFPELSKEDVKKILVHGWKQVVQYTSAGNDLNLSTPNIFVFFGKLRMNPLKAFRMYRIKLARRIYYMFKRSRAEWDGYCYFTRTERQYIDYLNQSRKKIKIFKSVVMYKLLDELKVAESDKPYIFRIKGDKNAKFHQYYEELKTKDAELIIQRDPMTMQDMMISNNNYKYLL